MRSEDYADGNDDQEGVWSEPDDPDVHAKTRDSGSSSEYCFDTPIPLLARDPFETVSEFDERINHHPPFVVGHGLLIKAEYDIETGRFPMEIRWGDPMVPIPGLPKTGDYSYIAAPRDQARAMYQLLSDPVEYPIFAHLSAADGAVSARKAVLSTKEGDFPIQWEGPLPGRRISLLPGFEFVFIPPGEFWMGGSEEEPERYGDESPRRRVRLT